LWHKFSEVQTTRCLLWPSDFTKFNSGRAVHQTLLKKLTMQ